MSQYPNFADFLGATSATADGDSQGSSVEGAGRRICIASPDLVGLVKNGGIGTSFLHTATIAARAGFDVVMLYTNTSVNLSTAEIAEAREFYAERGLELQLLHELVETAERGKFHPNLPWMVQSYQAYQYLKDEAFDLILFPEWLGVAFYSVQARRQGIAFEATPICVQTHSSSIWHALTDKRTNYGPNDAIMFHMEREAVRMADFVTSPTQYLLNWKADHGFTFPEHTYVQPYLLSFDDVDPTELPSPKRPDEFVFFGRLEERKGIRHFIDAIDRMVKTAPPEDLKGLSVTFLGKFTKSQSGHVVDEILARSAKWPMETKVLPTLSSDEAQDYLRSGNRVAFICSVADNSPLTVHECLHQKLPFIASDIGGIPEMIPDEFHKTHLVPLYAPQIAERMMEIRRDGHAPCPPKVNQSRDNIPTWLATLDAIPELPNPIDVVELTEPKVTVCITHYNRAKLLAKTVRGLQQQTYQNFDVIIVDDGSTDDDALAYLDELDGGNHLPRCQVLRQQNQYVGAARNRALREATGEYIIFMDDDNYARTDQFELFVKAIQVGGYDALTCAAVAFPNHVDPEFDDTYEHLFVPLGSGIAPGLFGNNYGDANAIYRRSAIDAVGGYTEDYGLSWEDYELFARMAVAGQQLGCIPEPLMYLRSTVGSVSRTSNMVANSYRALRPFLDEMPWDTFGDAVLISLSPTLNRYANMGRPELDSPEQHEVWAKIHQTEDGTIDNVRHVADHVALQGNPEQAERLLLDAASGSEGSRELLYDWALLRSRRDPAGMEDELGAFKRDMHVEIARAVARYRKTGKHQDLSHRMTQACETLGRLPVYELQLGILSVLEGQTLRGLALLSGVFDDADATYLAWNPDVVRAVDKGSLSNGLHHYLRYGADEGRPWPQFAPRVNVFAERIMRKEPEHLSDATGRHTALSTAGLDWKGRVLLWQRLLMSDHPLALVFASQQVKSLADATYEERYSDAANAVEAGVFPSALDHYLRHGADEGREYRTPDIGMSIEGTSVGFYLRHQVRQVAASDRVRDVARSLVRRV